MKFQPEKITREHILKAIKDIDNEEVGVRPSTKYDVLYNGKTYPPKDIMRLAHEYATGDYLWHPHGGEPTNKYLKDLGFQIVNKDSKNILIDVKQDFAEWLLKNAPASYKKMFLGNSIDSIISRLNEIESFFMEKKLFLINSDNIQEHIDYIKLKTSRKERAKNQEFQKYDSEKGSGIPKAVIGKNNYLKFLSEYTNSQLTSEDSLYTWVQTYRDIVLYLKGKENSQIELIEILKKSGCDIFNDQNPEGTIIPLEEIDPFTFFCYLNKYFKQRVSILQNLAQLIGSPIPNDDFGLPTANPQKVWWFPYKYKRKGNENEILWNLFYSVLNNELTDELFLKILKLKGVANAKLTEGLFYIDPEKYFPINRPTISYLKDVFNIDPKFNSYSEYKSILKKIKLKTEKPFYQISYDAWQWQDTNALSDFYQLIKKFDVDKYNEYIEILKDFVSKNNIDKDDLRISLNIRPNKNLIAFIIGSRYSWILISKNRITKFAFASKEKIDANAEIFSDEYDNDSIYLNHVDNIEGVQEIIFEGLQTELDRNYKTPYRINFNDDFAKEVFQMPTNKLTTQYMSSNKKISINQILFGPPGTGKTYNTINKALEITDAKFYNDNKTNRKALTERFKDLLIKKREEQKGQIAFCTFHQSFSYEDFVEGIKPKTNEKKDVYYEIEDGIFKEICQLADSNLSTLKVQKEGKLSWDKDEFRQASFYKLSLGNSLNSNDTEIYEYCRDHNYIAIGFGEENDFSGKSETEIVEACEDLKLEVTSAQQLNYFIHYLKIGNYVLISNGNKYVRALGKVVGNYEYLKDSPIRYNHFRKVEWLFVDENIPIEEIYERGLSQKTMYKIDETALKSEFFINKGQQFDETKKQEKNYVLIIDEINRGNVSSIFGELITLIEPNKRAGKSEELEVILPYSKTPFKVPHNVHIIGTMNTADRSIETLDTALRRRFSFEEMPPKPSKITTHGKSGKIKGIVDGINLAQLLEIINMRIEKLIDKDHKIGHSYFMEVDSLGGLKYCFEHKVIPLLEEYFFGDYGKIGLVLGDTFVSKIEDNFDFANFEGYDRSISDDLKQRAVYKINNKEEWDFKKI